ncbi:MAG: nucleotide exchange factor GrpE [Chloroflexi bacterium]|nr:nucleotide exchange factor GrpE [Chloroflexota bacterium]
MSEQDKTSQMESEDRTEQAPPDMPEAEDAPEEESVSAAQLEAEQAKAQEYLDGWQRERAELANYKKRMERELSNAGQNARIDFALKILPALDDFDLALQNLPEDLAGHGWVEGIQAVQRKWVKLLAEQGVVEIPAEGQTFDPTLHEAVMQVSSDAHESGQVVAVLRKGYQLDDRVIRATLVQVAE